MSRYQYFELCETLGSEPIEEEIPLELEDLPELVQTAFSLYETLQDEWEYMGGNYVGKRLSNILMLFDLYEIPKEEHLLVYKIISIVDSIRKDIIKGKSKS